MKVYVVFYGFGGEREIKRIFAHHKDAELYMAGAEAAYTSLSLEEWEVYEHARWSADG